MFTSNWSVVRSLLIYVTETYKYESCLSAAFFFQFITITFNQNNLDCYLKITFTHKYLNLVIFFIFNQSWRHTVGQCRLVVVKGTCRCNIWTTWRKLTVNMKTSYTRTPVQSTTDTPVQDWRFHKQYKTAYDMCIYDILHTVRSFKTACPYL